MKKKIKQLNLHGFSVIDALDTFFGLYNLAVTTQAYKELHVNHGYGSDGRGGRTRALLRLMLDEFCVEYSAGENIYKNFGMTVIRPINAALIPYAKYVQFRNEIAPINKAADRSGEKEELDLVVLQYCQSPKSVSMIYNKFSSQYRRVEIHLALLYLKSTKRITFAFDQEQGKHLVFSAPSERRT